MTHSEVELAEMRVEMRHLVASMDRMAGQLDDMQIKIAGLEQAAAMGRGAWWLALRIGGLILGVVAVGGLIARMWGR